MKVMPRIQAHARVVNADIFNMALSVISGDAQQRARVASDRANNIGKTERHAAAALKEQINYLNKVGAA